jgi:hypothetical protein
MVIKCCDCKKNDVADEYVEENQPEKSKCEICYVKWLHINISHLSGSIDDMQLELNKILSKRFAYSDSSDSSDSCDSSDDDYPEYNGETLREATTLYNSDEEKHN